MLLHFLRFDIEPVSSRKQVYILNALEEVGFMNFQTTFSEILGKMEVTETP